MRKLGLVAMGFCCIEKLGNSRVRHWRHAYQFSFENGALCSVMERVV